MDELVAGIAIGVLLLIMFLQTMIRTLNYEKLFVKSEIVIYALIVTAAFVTVQLLFHSILEENTNDLFLIVLSVTILLSLLVIPYVFVSQEIKSRFYKNS